MEKFKKIIKKIGNVIWILLNSKIFYYIIIVAMFIFAMNQCRGKHDAQVENTILEQNISAANDTIKVYKNRYGDVVAEKQIYIKSLNELKKENTNLYERIKQQEGKIISYNRTIISLKQDVDMLNDSIDTLNKIIGEAVQIDDNTWMIPWELNYDWDATNHDYFKGQTFVSVDTNPDGTFKLNPDGTLNIKHDDTRLLNRDSQIDIEFGEKVVDGKYNVFIQSKYPGFRPEDMEGVFIDPNTNKDIKNLIKKDHWFTGFSLSLSITPGYDVINNKAALVVGPSLSYNFYTW